MAGKQQTFQQWYSQLGEAMPLGLVPRVLKTTPEQVAGYVRRGALPVHTFRASDGRVLRYVRLRDVFLLGKNPLTLRGMARALQMMAEQPAASRSHAA